MHDLVDGGGQDLRRRLVESAVVEIEAARDWPAAEGLIWRVMPTGENLSGATWEALDCVRLLRTLASASAISAVARQGPDFLFPGNGAGAAPDDSWNHPENPLCRIPLPLPDY